MYNLLIRQIHRLCERLMPISPVTFSFEVKKTYNYFLLHQNVAILFTDGISTVNIGQAFEQSVRTRE